MLNSITIVISKSYISLELNYSTFAMFVIVNLEFLSGINTCYYTPVKLMETLPKY